MTTATGTDIMHGLIEAATWLGYHVHHETDSRRTNPGYPDLTVVGHGAIFVIETKSRGEKFIPPRTTKRGTQLPGQIDWLAAFAATGKAHTYVCRPQREDLAPSEEDWQEIAYDDLLAVLREQAGRNGE